MDFLVNTKCWLAQEMVHGHSYPETYLLFWWSVQGKMQIMCSSTSLQLGNRHILVPLLYRITKELVLDTLGGRFCPRQRHYCAEQQAQGSLCWGRISKCILRFWHFHIILWGIEWLLSFTWFFMPSFSPRQSFLQQEVIVRCKCYISDVEKMHMCTDEYDNGRFSLTYDILIYAEQLAWCSNQSSLYWEYSY